MISACSLMEPEDRFIAQKASFSSLQGWQQDNHAAALESFRYSCGVLAKKPRPQTEKSGISINAQTWANLCSAAARIQPEQAKQYFERYFAPYYIYNGYKQTGLFTGYYEPLLYGSLQKTARYHVPVYGKPEDLKPDTPYLTRQQIETQGLAGKADILVWVDDPVMLFFTHVQGSGRVQLPDGSTMRIGFAGRNHHDYVSVGKILREEGYVPEEKLDFFGIRQWFYDNPDKAASMMQRNPSYIFFARQADAPPRGSIGVALTPKRSLAVDPRYIPYGLPLFLQTTLPQQDESGKMSAFSKLLIAQDTGSAIIGPIRGDIFFGYGRQAEFYAGMLKSQGRYTLLVPKTVAYQLEKAQ